MWEIFHQAISVIMMVIQFALMVLIFKTKWKYEKKDIVKFFELNLLLQIFIGSSLDVIFYNTIIFLSLDALKRYFAYLVILQVFCCGVYFLFDSNSTIEKKHKRDQFIKSFIISNFVFLLLSTIFTWLTYEISFVYKANVQVSIIFFLLIGTSYPIMYMGSFFFYYISSAFRQN